MPSLPFAGPRPRVLVTALAIVLEIGLASLALPSTAHAQDAADARATVVAPLADVDALDDSVLARQRGGSANMVTVAVMPEAAAGALSVTLWDELARPAPAPRPVDTAGTTQFNAITYTRK